MKRIKKTIAIILCLIMAIGSMSVAFGETKDYEGHWAEAAIQKWIDGGRITGYPDGTFKPNGSIKRAEFVKMVNGIIDYDVKGSIAFNDVKADDWFYDQISIAQEIGYISGYSATQFGPDDNITREQAAAILSRIQYLKENSDAVSKFTDSASISSWAAGSVGAASNYGFISGHSDGSFKPKDNLSRAEAVTMLDNVLSNAKNHVVYKAGTKLSDMKISGDLIIAKTVGEGDAYLNNIVIDGGVQVYGGGMNSIFFNNVKVAKIEVEKDKVRLVFDDGTSVEEVVLGTEAKLENINGEIGKVTIDSDGKVTLSGKFDDVEVVSDSDIELDNATIENLVVNKAIKILGKGTIATLTANADGIQYESTAKITKTVVGANVTEKPAVIKEDTPKPSGGGSSDDSGGKVDKKNVVSITAVFDDGTPVSVGPVNVDYTTSSAISDVLITKLEELIPANEAKLNPYMASLERKLKSISINGISLYEADGVSINDEAWDKVVDNIKALGIEDKDKEQKLIDSFKSIEGELKVKDLQDILSLHEAFRKADGTLDTALLGKAADLIKEKADKITFSGTIEIETKKGTEKGSEAIEFAAENLAFSAKTVDEFFAEFGDATFKSTYNGKSFTLTIKKDSVPK